VLSNELRNARPLTSAFVKYSDSAVRTSRVFHAVAERIRNSARS